MVGLTFVNEFLSSSGHPVACSHIFEALGTNRKLYRAIGLRWVEVNKARFLLTWPGSVGITSTSVCSVLGVLRAGNGQCTLIGSAALEHWFLPVIGITACVHSACIMCFFFFFLMLVLIKIAKILHSLHSNWHTDGGLMFFSRHWCLL